MNYKIHDFRECRNIIETRAKILGYEAAQNFNINHISTKPTIIIGKVENEEMDGVIGKV
jgi:hypothetical protein